MKLRALPLLFAVTLAGCGSSYTEPPAGAGPVPVVAEEHELGAVLATQEQLESYPDALDPEDLEEDGEVLQRSARPPQNLLAESSVPPVANQGELMSCAAFAMAYNLISRVSGQGQRNLHDPVNQVSPAVAYRVALQNQGTFANVGTPCVAYLDTAVYYGGVSNASVPYPDVRALNEASQLASIANLNAPSLVPERRFSIGSWNSLEVRDQERIKDYLADNQMVAIGARVLANLATFQGDGVYQASGALLGGHAMVLTGYDEARQAFRVRNSWGPTWGDGGSFWMSYSTFADTVNEAYVARPFAEEPVQPGGSAFTVEFNGGQPGLPLPAGALTRAYQEPATGGGVVLVLFYQFDRGVVLDSVTLQSPSGKRITQHAVASTRTGYCHFTRQDGNQFLAGSYPVVMNIRTQDGSVYACRATVTVGPAGTSTLPAADFPARVTGSDGRPAEAVQ